MFVPKWLLESILERQDNLEKRVKRLEVMQLEDAQRKISSLKSLKTGGIAKSVLDIEEIIKESIN